MDRLTLEQAIIYVNELWQNDPQKTGKSFLSKQTVYNATSTGKVVNYGRRDCALYEKSELKRAFGPKKKKAA